MNIETLIEICRPGELKEYNNLSYHKIGGKLLDINNIENHLIDEYTLIDEGFDVSGNGGYLNDARYFYIIRKESTRELYKITTGHDSWSDGLISSFSYIDVTKVISEQITITKYNYKNNEWLESL